MSQRRDIWLRSLRYQTRIEAGKNEGILLKSAGRKHEVERVVVQRSTPMCVGRLRCIACERGIEYSSDVCIHDRNEREKGQQ